MWPGNEASSVMGMHLSCIALSLQLLARTVLFDISFIALFYQISGDNFFFNIACLQPLIRDISEQRMLVEGITVTVFNL